MIHPRPDEIRDARNELGLTQKQAARIVHVSLSAWQRYEAPANSNAYRLIPGAAWELFLLRTSKRRPEGSRFRLDGKLPKL